MPAKTIPAVRSSALFGIRPLEWKRNFQDWRQVWTATVPMGSYTVSRTREECDPDKPWKGWMWGYCFTEYYDESERQCANPAEGKREAWEDWQSRIMPALIEMPNSVLNEQGSDNQNPPKSKPSI